MKFLRHWVVEAWETLTFEPLLKRPSEKLLGVFFFALLLFTFIAKGFLAFLLWVGMFVLALFFAVGLGMFDEWWLVRKKKEKKEKEESDD